MNAHLTQPIYLADQQNPYEGQQWAFLIGCYLSRHFHLILLDINVLTTVPLYPASHIFRSDASKRYQARCTGRPAMGVSRRFLFASTLLPPYHRMGNQKLNGCREVLFEDRG
mmetsp:Transcript_20123/g.36178  ORF Transcript_20123/g.36178 Transcript_20123/m.36178 type:complete len:112 (+) Transcript_20123:245-580(+)